MLKFKQYSTSCRALPVIPGVFTNKVNSGNGSSNKQSTTIASNTLSKYNYVGGFKSLVNSLYS